MFLFIFESIGTSELILVGIIALIFLGPRKLPEIARRIGKIMAEFRGTANEFKETWQREVDFEDEAKSFDVNAIEAEVVARDEKLPAAGNETAMPAVKEVDPSVFENLMPPAEPEPAPTDQAANDKQNWL